jgi:glycosyltransferase involved in cell wall biosynthesis
VGNLLPVKDHSTMLRACSELAATRLNWRLLLVGEGSERPKLEGIINSHPDWSKRVSLLGASSRVPELLNAMDVYVLPSVNEGIANSLLEAMATALPVLTTNVGGNPEVVTDGESGLLFATGDSKRLANYVMRLSQARELRMLMGSNARRHAQQDFSLGAMVRNYEKVYTSVLPTFPVPVRVAAGV